MLPNRLRPGRVKRRPLHAAKRSRRRRLQVMPRLQLPLDTGRRARLGAKLRARVPKPSSPVPALLALVSRWRSGRGRAVSGAPTGAHRARMRPSCSRR